MGTRDVGIATPGGSTKLGVAIAYNYVFGKFVSYTGLLEVCET